MGVVRKYNLKSLTNYINHEKKIIFWILIDKKVKRKSERLNYQIFHSQLVILKSYWR